MRKTSRTVSHPASALPSIVALPRSPEAIAFCESGNHAPMDLAAAVDATRLDAPARDATLDALASTLDASGDTSDASCCAMDAGAVDGTALDGAALDAAARLDSAALDAGAPLDAARLDAPIDAPSDTSSGGGFCRRIP